MHNPALPLPLPLVLGGKEYDAQLLLVLHAQTAAAAMAEPADAPGASSSSPFSSGVGIDSGGAGSAGQRPAETEGKNAQFSSRRAGRSSSSVGRSGDSCTLVTAQLEHQRAVVTVDSVAVRLHAAGWEEAAQCLRMYAVQAEQAQRQFAAAAEARAASSAVLARPASAAATASSKQRAAEQASAAPAQQQHLAVQLHLQSLLVELVADAQQQRHSSGGGGFDSADGLVPVCTLQAQLQLDTEQAADGRSRLKLLLPGLLLAAGAVRAAAVAPPGSAAAGGAPAPLVLPLQESLLGLRHLEVSLLSQEQQRQLQPAATTADGSVLLGAAHQVSVGVTLAQASVWAHPRNLCAAAALAGHAQALAAGLAAQLQGGGAEFSDGALDRVSGMDEAWAGSYRLASWFACGLGPS